MDQIRTKQSLEMLLKEEEERSAKDPLDNVPVDLRELIIQTQEEIRAAFSNKKAIAASLK